ncbi:MAG TPA: hypothetical protein VMT86_22150 [Bryobacteraceae bacterium]|nr:hypothetical protein [Bryobacteraceae bacterium]
MKRIFLIAAGSLILAAALLYAGDYVVLRSKGTSQFGSVTVRRVYAVAQKNGSTEYMFDPPAPQACVNSLFSHMGSPPCWYLSKHPRQQIKVGEAPSRE